MLILYAIRQGNCWDYCIENTTMQYAEPQILLQLYVSLVRPHLEYASPVWNPYLQKNITTLENVQKFALKMCSKRWDQAYSQLLQLFDITKLSERRLYLDLCTMFKIVHGLFHFPSGIFDTYSGRTPSTNRSLLPSPALTTRLSLVQSLYMEHITTLACV